MSNPMEKMTLGKAIPIILLGIIFFGFTIFMLAMIAETIEEITGIPFLFIISIIIILLIMSYKIISFSKGSLDIEIGPDRLNPGDKIEGIINYNLKKDLILENITINLTIYNKTPTLYRYRKTVDTIFFNDTMFKKEINNRIPKGKYTQKFSFKLPTVDEIQRNFLDSRKAPEGFTQRGKNISDRLNSLVAPIGNRLINRIPKYWSMVAIVDSKGIVDIHKEKIIPMNLNNLKKIEF